MKTTASPFFYPKDFIQTVEGLIFAVVMHGVEQGKVLCFLRYVQEASGWKKYPTEQANLFLQQNYPDYLHFSPVLEACLHAVPLPQIVRHYQPRQRLQALMQATPQDAVEKDLRQLCLLLQQRGVDVARIGVTGSVLIGVQNAASDIDLVCYDRAVFQHCRTQVRELIRQGRLHDLTDGDWRQSYQRRESALSYAEYLWHERRKDNKALVNGRKFDLSYLDGNPSAAAVNYQKRAAITLQCTVTNDAYAFDYPAEFSIDHHAAQTVVSFTATYAGQAVTGERVEISGILEETSSGLRRIVVGSSREAAGEYIKVLRPL
jgi:predicted nucleotidyltransferase